MKNPLTLHEAIAKILLTKSTKTATYDEIALEIDEQNLYPNRRGNISFSKQIYLRTSIASSRYKGTWFEVVDRFSIKLVKE